MYDFPIGVILESFKTNRAAAIEKAAKMGANGIQMYATEGENSPENLLLYIISANFRHSPSSPSHTTTGKSKKMIFSKLPPIDILTNPLSDTEP